MSGPLLLIAGGGTGGHVSPGLGVAREWLQRYGEASVAWVGRRGGIEEGMAGNVGLRFLHVPSAALKRSLSLSNLKLPWVLWEGFMQARALLKTEAPAAVLLTGGFVGMPLGLAAGLGGTPLVLLEPNAVPGLANRILKPLAKALCLAYPPRVPGPKTVVTGTPCRLAALPSPAEAKRGLGLDESKKTLLVMPGSQAAKAVNAALRAALPLLKDRAGDWQILWMCGAAELDACQEAALASPLAIQCLAFIHDVAPAYAAADLLLCRSGASTLVELAYAGKPSLQVPYPHATGDHQRANAAAFAAAGAAEVLDEKGLGPDALAMALRALLDGEGLAAMAAAAQALGKPQAAQAVCQTLEASARL